jgi:hypothetical protein
MFCVMSLSSSSYPMILFQKNTYYVLVQISDMHDSNKICELYKFKYICVINPLIFTISYKIEQTSRAGARVDD